MSQTSKSTFIFVQFCQILVLSFIPYTIFPFFFCFFCIVLYFGFHVYLAYPCILSLFHWLSPCRTKYLGTNAPNVSSLRCSLALRSSRVPDTVRGRRTTFRFHSEHITDISKVKIGKKKGRKQEKRTQKTTSVAFFGVWNSFKVSWWTLESKIWKDTTGRAPETQMHWKSLVSMCTSPISAANHDSCFTPSWFWNFLSYPLSSLTWIIFILIGTLLTSVHSPGWVVSSGFASLSCSSRSCPKWSTSHGSPSRWKSEKSWGNPVLHRQL